MSFLRCWSCAVLLAAIAAFLAADQVSASSVVPIPQNFDASCRSVTNGPGFSFRPVNTNGEYITPSNVLGIQGQAAIEYRYNPAGNGGKGAFDWRLAPGSTKNINVVNLVTGKLFRIRTNSYVYGGFGVESDTNLRYDINPVGVVKVVFCYGVNGPNPVTLQASTPICANATGALAGVAVLCPLANDGTPLERVITVANPADPNFDIQACTCVQPFDACDPAAPASTPNSCQDSTTGSTVANVVTYEDGGGSTFCLRGSNPLTCYKRK